MTKQQLKIQEMVSTYSPEGVYHKVLDGTLSRFPKGFWYMPENHIYAARCTRYLIEEVLKWNRQQVCDEFNVAIIRKYRLTTLGSPIFGFKVFDILDNAYPGEFKPWELSSKWGYWTEDTIKRALGWVINDKLCWSIDDVKELMCADIIIDNKLITPLIEVYKNSVYDMVNDYYGGKIKPWELRKCNMPTNYWNDTNIRYALNWMFKDKLKWTVQDVKEKFTLDTLVDHGLGCIIGEKLGGGYVSS